VIRRLEPPADAGTARGSGRRSGENVIRRVEPPADAGDARRFGWGPGEPTGIRGSHEGEVFGGIHAMVAEFSSTTSGKPIEAIKLDPRLLAESGKQKLSTIGEKVQHWQAISVDPSDLEDLMGNILRVVQSAGDEAIARAAENIVRDPASLEVLRDLAENVGRLTELATQVAERITPSESAGGQHFFWWVLAGAILLGLGVNTMDLRRW
jgi:hypothetical protein